jgi:signal transduction histidine kinase
VLRRLGQAGGRRGRPDALDAAWASLLLLGLACIVIYAQWQAVPFHFVWITAALLMFGLVMRYAHRRQAADTERARVSEENARLLAAQRRFLQDASHQLKTPITIALGHAELLAGELTDPRRSRDVHVVVGELTKLKSLAERLLLIATSENPDFLRPEPVALDGFIMEVLRRWRPTAQRRWQLGRLDPVTVSADRDRLGLAVDALLENAVQHTGPGDEIRLAVRRLRGSARVVVEDSGSGIPQSELAYIFDRFRTGSGNPRGTGLGLALTRAIAHGHGGEVLAHSTPGAGSKFEVVLPADSADSAQLTDAASANDVPAGVVGGNMSML